MFKNKNLNPKNQNTTDCVIRAIAGAEDREWLDVFNELCQLTIATGFMLNDRDCYEKYLLSLGYKKFKTPRKANNKKVTVGSFAKMNPKGVFILRTPCHITLIKNGIIQDTWNTSSKYIGNYFSKQ